MNPFLTLLDIEDHCKANSVNIPRQIAMERDWLGIGFKSSNFNFVCPMQVVSEVLIWPALTEVPAAQSWFRGTANLRGRILSVTDLQGFVSGVPHKPLPLSRILVVKLNDGLSGFAVEQVLGIERFFGEEIKPVASLLQAKEYLRYAKGAFERDNQPWIILDFAAIIESTEFYHLLTARMDVA